MGVSRRLRAWPLPLASLQEEERLPNRVPLEERKARSDQSPLLANFGALEAKTETPHLLETVEEARGKRARDQKLGEQPGGRLVQGREPKQMKDTGDTLPQVDQTSFFLSLEAGMIVENRNGKRSHLSQEAGLGETVRVKQGVSQGGPHDFLVPTVC